MPIVRVDEISRHYGEGEARVVALDRVSVDIERDERPGICAIPEEEALATGGFKL